MGTELSLWVWEGFLETSRMRRNYLGEVRKGTYGQGTAMQIAEARRELEQRVWMCVREKGKTRTERKGGAQEK